MQNCHWGRSFFKTLWLSFLELLRNRKAPEISFFFKSFVGKFIVAIFLILNTPVVIAEEAAENVAEQPAFGDMKWKFFDVSWDAPMNTVSGITEWSKDINDVYGLVTWISVFVFFAVSIPLVYTLIRFRRREGDQSVPKQFHGNSTLEVLWTVIPVILLIFIAVPTWRVLFKHAKPQVNAMKIEAIGHQWWWEFRYPDLGITTANELHVPENTAINLTVYSEDVIHAFWIPKWGGKVDALPGHKNHLSLTSPALVDSSKRGGEMYQGQCLELCGASHALMRFNAVVHTQQEFNSWAKTANSPPVVETASQKAGEEVFLRCQACHAITGTPSAQIPGVKIGPDLTNFGSRKYLGAGVRQNTPENFAAWVKNPSSIKPGSLMPNLGLTDEEIAHVSSYLRQSTVKSF